MIKCVACGFYDPREEECVYDKPILLGECSYEVDVRGVNVIIGCMRGKPIKGGESHE